MEITKDKVVWWRLFPIRLGDRVKEIKTGKIGWVANVTIPCSHSGEEDINIEFYRKTTFKVIFKDEETNLGYSIKEFKRWELMRIERET